ncbi:MAG: tyrosine-type recombinase/integrase [bacterium]
MRLCSLSMMLCGPRLGEIIPLTWYDLDFNSRLWTINKSVEKLENEYIVKPDTKNHKSRCIKAPVELTEEFKIAKSRAKSKYIFCKTNGEMHTPSSFRSAWNSYLCKLNYCYGVYEGNITSIYNPHGIPFTIDRITPHMLRHPYVKLTTKRNMERKKLKLPNFSSLSFCTY